MHLKQRSIHSRRSGFTLIELMVVMVLLSVVVGGLVKVIAGQQRFYRSAGDLMESRSQIRQAISLLPSDLRGVSTVGSDIISASDTSVNVRSTIASSLVCSANAGTRTFSLPPGTLTNGQVLTAGRTVPGAGDMMFVYDDGATTGRTDDSWVMYTVTNLTQPPGNCIAPFMQALDLPKAGWQVTVAEPISATIVQGAPVRFLRQLDYRLYTASDGKSYLGYIECPGGVCTAVQPVSGPYRRYVGAGDAANGLQIQYFDAAGTEFTGAQLADRTNLNNIARIAITVRGETASAMAVPGMAAVPKQDELRVQVGVRNTR